MRDYILRGYKDFQDEDPWAHAPMSYEEWWAGAPETPEQQAYWRGFNAAGTEAVARARDNRRKHG